MTISGINFGSLTNKPAALRLDFSKTTKAYMSEASKTETSTSPEIQDSFIISPEARQKLQAYQNEIKAADDMAYKAKEKSLADQNVPVQLAKFMSQEAPTPTRPGKVAEIRQKIAPSKTEVASSYPEGGEAQVQTLIDNGAPVQLARYMNKENVPQAPVVKTAPNSNPIETAYKKGNEAEQAVA